MYVLYTRLLSPAFPCPLSSSRRASLPLRSFVSPQLTLLPRTEPPRQLLSLRTLPPLPSFLLLPTHPLLFSLPSQGEFILVLDSPLPTLPRRPSDSSFCLVNLPGPHKRTYKLNVSETGKELVKPPPATVGEDGLLTGGHGAAGKTGNGVLVNREGGFEFQRELGAAFFTFFPFPPPPKSRRFKVS